MGVVGSLKGVMRFGIVPPSMTTHFRGGSLPDSSNRFLPDIPVMITGNPKILLTQLGPTPREKVGKDRV